MLSSFDKNRILGGGHAVEPDPRTRPGSSAGPRDRQHRGLRVASPVLGVSGTGWYPFGEGKTVMSVQALLREPVPVPGAPQLGSGAIEPGSRDSVEMSGANRVDVTFWAPTADQRAAYLAGPLVVAGAGLFVPVLLLSMVRSLRVDEPFTLANVYRTTAIGVTVSVAGTLGPVITQLAGSSLLESSAAAPLVQTTTFTLSVGDRRAGRGCHRRDLPSRRRHGPGRRGARVMRPADGG